MRRRRRNPAMSKTLQSAAGVTVGVLGSSVIGELISSSMSLTGTSAVIGQAATAFGLSFIAKRVSKDFGNDVMVGGVAAVLTSLALAAMNISMPAGLAGLAGGRLGFYVNNSYPLPTYGNGPYLLNAGYNGVPSMNGSC